MDDADPITQFFSDPTDNILYITLGVEPTASTEEIRKSYRRLALKFHPDKHVSKTDEEKEGTSKEFQRVGFAYAVLSDENRRKK